MRTLFSKSTSCVPVVTQNNYGAKTKSVASKLKTATLDGGHAALVQVRERTPPAIRLLLNMAVDESGTSRPQSAAQSTQTGKTNKMTNNVYTKEFEGGGSRPALIDAFGYMGARWPGYGG